MAARINGKSNLVLGNSETFLDHAWADTSLAVEGYQRYRADRPFAQGGGLLVYAPTHLAVKRRFDLELEGIESIWLEFNFPRSSPILVCFVYRAPSEFISYLTLLEDMISRANFQVNTKFIVTGALNFDLLGSPRPCSTKSFFNIFQ